MAALPLLFLAALTVKQDQTALRRGCDASDELIANLPADTRVEPLFVIADGSNCYKVNAVLEGRTVTGYISGAALNGTDEFEKARAVSSDLVEHISAPRPVKQVDDQVRLQVNEPSLVEAGNLIDANQPAQALQILETLSKIRKRDPDLFALAGIAAYRSDQIRMALDYWRQSLELRPNDSLARLYAIVEKEAAADKSADKLYGNRVLLRYEGETLPAEIARAAVALVDSEFARISSDLGCTSDERIVVIVQSREAYYKTTGAAEWSGGQYNGRIHIALLEGHEIGPQTRKALAHEVVHACLTNIPSGAKRWPAWFQEGMAQKLTGDQLSPETRLELQRLASAHQLPKLEDLGQNWSQMSSKNARAAYDLALAAVDLLYQNYQNYGIRNVLNNPERLPQITADLDHRLG